MPTIQLRNLPEDTYLAIKESAKKSKRSMTQEAILLIEIGLCRKKNIRQTKIEAFKRLKEMEAMNPIKVSLDEILEMIAEDRNR